MLSNTYAANAKTLPQKPKKATNGQIRVEKRKQCNRRAKILPFTVFRAAAAYGWQLKINYSSSSQKILKFVFKYMESLQFAALNFADLQFVVF